MWRWCGAGAWQQAVREAAQADELGPGNSTAEVTRAVLARLQRAGSFGEPVKVNLRGGEDRLQ
jgi:hypothetical protein